MKKTTLTPRGLTLFMFISLPLLMGCEKTREVFGLSRGNPDEFRLSKRPTLTRPASTHLHQPVAASVQDSRGLQEVQDKAQRAMGFSMAKAPSLTPMDQAFLLALTQQGISKTIHDDLRRDWNNRRVFRPDPWAQKLFLWQENPDTHGTPLDPHGEFKRLHGYDRFPKRD